MAENNTEKKEEQAVEIRYCKVIYRQQLRGGSDSWVEIHEAKVPLDMDEYDTNVAYKDNLEYYVQGLVDAGYCVITNEFIPWHNIERIAPCREVATKKKQQKRKPRRPRKGNKDMVDSVGQVQS